MTCNAKKTIKIGANAEMDVVCSLDEHDGGLHYAADHPQPGVTLIVRWK